ncbi:sulfite exporter TauE/SafE family protein [Siphonobacter curvatus]|uniref:Sulfite exporter TauE/SafE family protein n=1 Tax=Siphonobacter curvatus TaxID=2094562 RepID=A0A2S7IT15_9BACT|nr:sulfite exporter TauE/SafE family protein [Siphonobacter curvatus]PQA60845.1 sulfite exporter TauE/SafE family protein [Siphonobacter curvatus]
MVLAFLTGLLSSIHCVGMCGPIALALPVGGLSEGRMLLARLSYNLARTLSYGLLGLLVGFVGERVSILGWQQYLSLLAGVLMAGFVLADRWIGFSPFVRLKSTFSKLLQQKTWVAYVGVGFINGWLPCGMVYVALAGALATATPVQGMLWMLAYGAGTIPAMLAVGWIWQWVSLPVRRTLNRWVPVLTLAIALLFVWRGLGLNLPSRPGLPSAAGVPVCHEK